MSRFGQQKYAGGLTFLRGDATSAKEKARRFEARRGEVKRFLKRSKSSIVSRRGRDEN